ncbi:MAG: helix-turn-helix domain-containing protein [Bacilli bacterium]|nr:helix-turn-helix domain-containing protein [Bacilli bacterium]
MDVSYIATNLANLTGVPTRLYQNQRQALFRFVSSFPVDPIRPHEEAILQAKGHVSYYLADRFCYYGILSFPEGKIVIGPARQSPMSDQELSDLCFELDVPFVQSEDFKSAMKSIVGLPLSSLLQALCVTNHILNDGEKLSLKDIEIVEATQTRIEEKLQRESADESMKSARPENLSAFAIEQTMLSYVQKGQTSELQEYFRQMPSAQSGIPSSDYVRYIKDTFVVATTLVSRAAIQGGLNPDESLSLSDSYIGECEAEQSIGSIINLQFRMVMDYSERVERLHIKEGYSQLVIDTIGYIRRNISSPLTTEKIAMDLYVSRTYLSTRFKEETGTALYQYITNAKIENAKRLLRYTDRSLGLIASHLGYSSQSHFARVFKAETKMTPLEYRNTYRNR